MKNKISNSFENIQKKAQEFIQNEESKEISPIFEKQMEKEIFLKRFGKYLSLREKKDQENIKFLIENQEDIIKLIENGVIVEHDEKDSLLIQEGPTFLLKKIYEANNKVEDIVKLKEAGYISTLCEPYRQKRESFLNEVFQIPNLDIQPFLNLFKRGLMYSLEDIEKYSTSIRDSIISFIKNPKIYEKLILELDNVNALESFKEGNESDRYIIFNIFNLPLQKAKRFVDLLENKKYESQFIVKIIKENGIKNIELLIDLDTIGLFDNSDEESISSILNKKDLKKIIEHILSNLIKNNIVLQINSKNNYLILQLIQKYDYSNYEELEAKIEKIVDKLKNLQVIDEVNENNKNVILLMLTEREGVVNLLSQLKKLGIIINIDNRNSDFIFQILKKRDLKNELDQLEKKDFFKEKDFFNKIMETYLLKNNDYKNIIRELYQNKIIDEGNVGIINERLETLSEKTLSKLLDIIWCSKFLSIKKFQEFFNKITTEGAEDAIDKVSTLFGTIDSLTQRNRIEEGNLSRIFKIIDDPNINLDLLKEFKKKNLLSSNETNANESIDNFLIILENKNFFSDQKNIKILEYLSLVIIPGITSNNIQEIIKILENPNFDIKEKIEKNIPKLQELGFLKNAKDAPDNLLNLLFNVNFDLKNIHILRDKGVIGPKYPEYMKAESPEYQDTDVIKKDIRFALKVLKIFNNNLGSDFEEWVEILKDGEIISKENEKSIENMEDALKNCHSNLKVFKYLKEGKYLKSLIDINPQGRTSFDKISKYAKMSFEEFKPKFDKFIEILKKEGVVSENYDEKGADTISKILYNQGLELESFCMLKKLNLVNNDDIKEDSFSNVLKNALKQTNKENYKIVIKLVGDLIEKGVIEKVNNDNKEFILVLIKWKIDNSNLNKKKTLTIESIKEMIEKFQVKDLKEFNCEYLSQLTSISDVEIFKGLREGYLNKENFKEIFEEEGEKFLESLPDNKIERRNALTNNLYDRTSQFMNFIVNNPSLLKIYKTNKENLAILSKYLKKFGFNKSEILIQSFFAFEKNQKELLPTIVEGQGIKNIEELEAFVKKIKNLCISKAPISVEDVEKLGLFGKEILLCITNYYNHKWFQANQELLFSRIPEKQNDLLKYHEAGNETLAVFKEKETKISPEKQATYNKLRKEIYNASKNINLFKNLKKEAIEIYNSFIINMNFDKIPEEIQIKMKEKIKKNQDELQKVDDIESLFINILKISKQKIGKKGDRVLGILRQICFQKICKIHQNQSNLIENIQTKLDKDKIPSLEDITLVGDLIKNHLKDHVANIQDEKANKYWSAETMQSFKKLKFKNINKIMNIKGELEEIEDIRNNIILNREEVSNIDVEIIPDTGIIGEMSGYLGNACYTKVVPLLEKYPNLIPYKFIANEELVGSCLVFKVDDINNEPVLLIRALNLPEFENKIDIGEFIEKYFDQIVISAKKQGIKKIIAAPDAGTISNYQGVTSYVTKKYGNNEEVKLKETFDFNGYDITNQCILVREIK